MDEMTMYILAIITIFISPIAIVFLIGVLGMMIGMICGIIGKVFDFFTDSIAGQESTNFGENKED